MNMQSECTKKGCGGSRCRRLYHMGYEGSLGKCPDDFHADSPIYDCRMALGVCCFRCGAYWIPEEVPESVRDTCEPWELGRWSNLRSGHGVREAA